MENLKAKSSAGSLGRGRHIKDERWPAGAPTAGSKGAASAGGNTSAGQKARSHRQHH